MTSEARQVPELFLLGDATEARPRLHQYCIGDPSCGFLVCLDTEDGGKLEAFWGDET